MNGKNDKDIIEIKEVEAERIYKNETFRPWFITISLSPLFIVGILIYVISAFGVCLFILK